MRAFLIVAAATVALAAQEQAPRPSFKAGIGLVQLDVSVLDGRRQPIRGLQASDFTILEDGTPRPIRVFDAIELPPRPLERDAVGATDGVATVATNQIGDRDGRLVFILMDRTIALGQPSLAAKQIATAAVDALGPSDLAAIVTTGGNVPQTLTADRARLLRAIDQGDWTTIISPEQQEIVGKYDPFSDGRCLCGLCVLETVTNIAEAARDAPRRPKLLLFIGSSIIVQAGPRPMAADPGCDSRVRDARRKMMSVLSASHLTVHSIDPSGLVSAMPLGSGNGRPGGDAPVRRQQMLDNTIQMMSDHGSLEVLPELTGGRAITSTNKPELKVPEIFRETDAYYVLAYEPADAVRSARPRSIEVKVSRAGARVTTTRSAQPQAVNSRIATGERSPLDLALAGLLPDARVPLDMAAAAFAAATGTKAYVTVTLDAAAIGARDGQGGVDVALSVSDQRGRRVASVREGGLALRTGANVQTHVIVPPGDYELRAAIQARDTGVAASVFSQLAVASFADAPLSMSNLVMGTRENPDPPPDADAPDISVIASTQRTFPRSGIAWAFAQIYQGTQRTDAIQPVAIRTTVIGASRRTVREESASLGADSFTKRRAAVRIRLPLSVLSPGAYVLRVTVTQGPRTASRAAAFTVE